MSEEKYRCIALAERLESLVERGLADEQPAVDDDRQYRFERVFERRAQGASS